MVWCGLVGFDLVSYGLFQIKFSMVWCGYISRLDTISPGMVFYGLVRVN